MTADPISDLVRLVNAQADDEGLWFVAETCPEGYLQQELRKLHEAVEKAMPEKFAPKGHDGNARA